MEGGTREKLVELLRKFDNAMLVTASANGSMRSRPMALLQVEPDGDMWFMTSGHSGKIDEIAADSHVNVALQKDREYVSVCGRARVLRDRAKVDELWNEHMRAYFPNGKDDPDLVLLQVQAEEGEYWDNQGAQGLKY
jgi:general stress protein 26